MLRSDQRRFGRTNSVPGRVLAVGWWEERWPVKAFVDSFSKARGLAGKSKNSDLKNISVADLKIQGDRAIPVGSRLEVHN